jgi:hypothetical protein
MKDSQMDPRSSSIPRNQRVTLLLLVIVTFAAHLTLGLYYVTGPMSPFRGLTLKSHDATFLNSFPNWNEREEFDDAAYNRAAVEVLHTGIPRDHTGSLFVYAPVYSYFVAACYTVGGVRLLALAIPQAVLSSLTCGLLALATYHLARQSKFVAALITGALFLTNARIAMYVGYVSPTILLAFFFSAAVWAASQPLRPSRCFIFAASLILATGTQAGFFLIALAAGIWLAIRFLKTRNRAELITAITILLFAAIKNFFPALLHQERPNSVSEIGRAVVWEANNPYYEDMTPFSLWERRPGNQWTHWKMSSEQHGRYEEYLERSNHQPVRAALLWIRENPMQYGKLVFVRFWTTLGPFTGMMSPRNRLISLVVWLLSFPAGAYGWWLYRRTQISEFAGALAISVILSSSLVIVEWYLRYRFPLDMLLTVFAGVAYPSLIFSRAKSAVHD